MTATGRSRYWLNTVLGVGLAALGIAGIVAIQLPQLADLKSEATQGDREALQQEVEAQRNQLALLKQVPAFGFNNVMADWVFLKFLQYFGDTSARNLTSYELNPEFFDIILAQDPYFRDGYFFLSGSTSLYAGMPDRAVEIMNREIVHTTPFAPDRAYYLWRYKATDEYLFLGDAEAAVDSLQTGAEWADQYNDEDGQRFAENARSLAQAMAERPNNRVVRLSVWGMALANAFDQESQRRIIREIEALGGRVTEDGRIVLSEPDPPASATPAPAAPGSDPSE